MIYLIDNTDHQIHFVETDPKTIDPLLVLLEKAWPRSCRRCGAIPQRSDGPANKPCVSIDIKRPGSGTQEHYFGTAPFVIATAEKFEWRLGGSQTLAAWLEEMITGLSYEVADLRAARLFHEKAVEIVGPGVLWVGSFDYYLRD